MSGLWEVSTIYICELHYGAGPIDTLAGPVKPHCNNELTLNSISINIILLHNEKKLNFQVFYSDFLYFKLELLLLSWKHFTVMFF